MADASKESDLAGLERFTAILHLFDEAAPTWTVQGIADRLEIPASTVYRSVRALVADGFLAPAGEAHYRLGTAFLEFDRLIRLTDPLTIEGAAILASLVERAGMACVGLVSSLYGDTVMCVADAAAGTPAFRSSYERGRPMPLLRGATSKVILADLPTRRLKQLIARASDLSDDARRDAFRKSLGVVRRQGYCVARGEIDPGLAGLAVPVRETDAPTTASLSLVVREQDLTPATERSLVTLLTVSSALLAEALARRKAGA
ncbi:DNA-binding IclR family transcriptional regulator [Amorphus suaedae]